MKPIPAYHIKDGTLRIVVDGEIVAEIPHYYFYSLIQDLTESLRKESLNDQR